MNDLFFVLLIYLLEPPFPYLGAGTATLGIWHDELMHMVDLFEAAFLTTTFSMNDLFNVLCNYLLVFPFPSLARGLSRSGPGTTR